MRRVYATFEDEADASAAEGSLREADLEPEEPDVDNPFFDPTVEVPEARGWLWGGLVGGVVGALLFAGLSQYVFWVPRISPVMTAGPYALAFLGFGLGVAAGGFLGGVAGTYRDLPAAEGPQVAVTVPDHRVDDVSDRLRASGAVAVDDTVTFHEHPRRARSGDAGD